MHTFAREILLLIGGLIGGVLLMFWIAGTMGKGLVLQCLVGAIVLTPLLFIVATACKMPFVGFRKSLFALGLITFVAFVTIETLDVLESIQDVGSISVLTGLPPGFMLGSVAILLLACFSS